MPDTSKLRKTIQDFEFYARPASSNGRDPCTVDDFDNLIRRTKKVLSAIVDELDSME